jgi:peptidoglycan/xylan/chitin deacetylase (PgdA/CDA1 family)
LLSFLRHIIKKHTSHKAIVLMYHRVAETESDIWDIAVSPENFEQQLQLLKQTHKIIPLKELVHRIKKNNLNRNYVCITFDDGYEDNFLHAKPILENYQIPATFFITSTNIDKESIFWWDELEELILYSKHLPSSWSKTISHTAIDIELGEEAWLDESQKNVNSKWKSYSQPPPSRRCELFLKLWEQLKLLPAEAQQDQLSTIRQWIGTDTVNDPLLKSMSYKQLKSLSENPLFEIGAHTFSHPSLACLDTEGQKKEISENRKHLQSIIDKEVTLLSYPYGDYSTDTVAIVSELGFEAAFTTEEKPVSGKSNNFRLARYQVKNYSANALNFNLKQWFSQPK